MKKPNLHRVAHDGLCAGFLMPLLVPGLARAQDGPAPEAPPPAAPVLTEEGVYRHPIGAQIRLPEGWKIQEQVGETQLVPPDARSNEQGPTEAYFLVTMTADGATRADDPRVAEGLAKAVARIAPDLQLVGDLEPLAAGSEPGIRLTWEETSRVGVPVRFQGLAVVARRVTFALFGLGVKDHVAAREATMREILASFTAGEGERDPSLVGDWYHESCESFRSGTFTGATQLKILIRLQENGTGLRAEQSLFVGDAGETSDEFNVGVEWFAARGALYLIGENGEFWTLQYGSQDESGVPILTASDGEKAQLFRLVR